MSTYSVSDAIAVEGSRASSSRAEAIGDWLKSSGIGVAAAIAWIAFGLSCLWWPDLGDWSRTYALGIAAFVVAAFALFGTLSADFLGAAGPALAPPRAVACRARPVPDRVGTRDRKVRLAAVAVLPAAAIDPRGLYRRSAKTARQRLCLGEAATRRLCHRRDRRLPDRCFDRLVAKRRLLGASGAALHRPAAGHRVASDRLLHLSRRAGAPARS